MAERVRSFDWASTPLGAIGSWSSTLASYVNLVLSSPQPAVLMWGQDLVLFYNDSAVATLGEKHPDALGRSHREVFLDAWPIVGPDIEECLSSGRTAVRENVCVPLVRNGRLKEHYYTYFLVPVYEGGRIAGVYDPFLDVTQQHQDQLTREKAAIAQSFLLELTDAYRTAGNGREIMKMSAELLGRHLNVGRVGYSEAAPDLKSMNFETGWAQGKLNTLSGSVPFNHWSEDTSADFSRGRTVVYPDVRTEPTLTSEVENYIAIGATSVVAVPFLRRGVWRGSLYVNDSEPRLWTTQEVSLIEEVALRTAEAVERAQAEEELRALASRLSMAQQAGRMASWQCDLATNTLNWDGGSEWIYGRPPAELTHVSLIYACVHEEDREKVRRELAPAIVGTGEYRSEFRVVWPDGSLHWILAFGRTVRSANGAPTGIIGININVTEQKQAETALLQTEKLAVVGRLASSIAHEINNPLESVTNLLYLARITTDAIEIRAYLDTAEQELRRVSVIANQTLRFHKQSTKPSLISSDELFDSVLSVFHGRLVGSHVHVERRKRSTRNVECFEGEIRQVLNNVIGNAIEAMQPLGGRLLLRSRDVMASKGASQGILLTVADTGPGMPESVVQRIFEAFYTTKGTGGTGLGLWVSKEIMDRHHGNLRVRSSQRKDRSGTVFTIFLPSSAAVR